MFDKMNLDMMDKIVNKLCFDDSVKLILCGKIVKTSVKLFDKKKKETLENVNNLNLLGRLAQIRLNIEYEKSIEKIYSANVSIFENSKSRYYDVEYHKLIVIRDIFENLDVFKMKYLNNKELESKLDYVGEILKLFKNKLKDMKEKEDKCNILREISYDLT